MQLVFTVKIDHFKRTLKNYLCDDEGSFIRAIFDDYRGPSWCWFDFNNEIFELDVMVVVDGFI